MDNPNLANDLTKAYIITITIAGILALVGYLVPRGDDATQDIYRVSDSLITGALGFFAGRAVTHMQMGSGGTTFASSAGPQTTADVSADPGQTGNQTK